MSFSSKIETKYTKIEVTECTDEGKPFYYATVGLAWMNSAPPRSRLFTVTMDGRLLDLVRSHLATAVEDVKNDIYINDVDLLVNLKTSEKHQAAKLLGIVEKVEAEFDAMTEEAK